MIEFALVALPLIAIIGAILEYSLLALGQTELQAGATAAARMIRVSTVSSLPLATYQTEVCRTVRFLQNCAANINIELRSSDSFDKLENDPSVAANSTALNPLNVGPAGPGAIYTSVTATVDPGQAGSLIVTFDRPIIFPFLRAFENVPAVPGVRRLSAQVIFRKEN